MTEEQLISDTYIKSLQSRTVPSKVPELRRPQGRNKLWAPHLQPATKCRASIYLNATYGIRSWLLTTDHKRIAMLYLVSVTFFFFIGGAFAHYIRIHLAYPSGLLVTRKPTNKLFTMHGVAMIFFS